MEKLFVVYITTNKFNKILYTGVTSNLPKRIYEHKNKITGGFTGMYNCDKLVYYEVHETAESAIMREKQIKSGSRKKKVDLIEATNSLWQDLYNTIVS